jgi:hypothetical protein
VSADPVFLLVFSGGHRPPLQKKRLLQRYLAGLKAGLSKPADEEKEEITYCRLCARLFAYF